MTDEPKEPQEVEPEELEDEDGELLPDREAMAVINPFPDGPGLPPPID